jgi:alkylation response protein AidB-like acyl-CoA dehydrogenase
VREFAEAELRPHVREWDEAQELPREFLPKLAELGLMGIQFPEEFGGAAMSAVDYCICIEELARVDPSVSLTVAAHNGLGAAHIAMFGTNEQKRTYLAPLARGEKLAAWGLTEASAGSDAGAMRTSAVRDGDCWVINGTKQFITHGRTGDTMVVMAVTNKTKGSRGITAFIVERGTDGFTVGRKEDKLGIRASSTCELLFEHCRVPKADVLGEAGKGYKVAIETLNEGRIGIGAQMVGLAQGALDHTIRYVKERKQFGKAIADFQGVQFQIARAATEVAASRLLVYNAARLRDAGLPFLKEAAMGKLFASEVAERTASLAVNLYGGYGFVKDYPVEKLYRDAKIGQIYEGTSNLQLQTIAKQLLG